MADAKRDSNYIPTLLAVSNADGVTPVVLWADPTTHRLLVSSAPGALDDLTDVTITSVAQGDLLYYNGSAWVNLAAGTSGRFLKTQGAGANPIWDVPTAGAAGSDTQVQFNDGGTNLGGDAGFTYNKTTDAVSANGGFLPIANDTGALGSAAKSFADLFLASGGLINWANSDAVITHSAGVLTVSTGDLRVTTAGANSASVVTVGGSQTLTSKTLTSPVINTGTIGTSLLPTANDGAALGASGTAFADLFLASGAVINFNAGNYTVTHSAGLLTTNGALTLGGTLAMAANSITMTGSLAATGARVTKGWFTDIESTNMPTVGGTAILTSLTAPQFTTIELGAASDTTLSRVSAGVIAVEGNTVLTVAGGTLTGSITLGENTGIALDPAGSADGKWSGITITGVSDYSQAFGDLVYLKASNSRWAAADADSTTTAGPVMLAMVISAGTSGNACTLLLQGQIRADAKFPALTIGAPVYVGETAGEIQVAIPTGADNVIRVVGFALTADEIYFNPSQDHQTTVA